MYSGVKVAIAPLRCYRPYLHAHHSRPPSSCPSAGNPHMPVMPLPISHRRSQTDFCFEVTRALFEEPDSRLAHRVCLTSASLSPCSRVLKGGMKMSFCLFWPYSSPAGIIVPLFMYWRRHLAIDPCWHSSCFWGSYGHVPYPIPGRSHKRANVYRKSGKQAGNVYGQECYYWGVPK